MSYHFVKKTYIDKDLLSNSDKFKSSALPVPSIEELFHLAKCCQANLRVIIIYDENEVVAASICYVEPTTIHSLKVIAYRSFGDTLHDYGHLYATSRPAYDFLVKQIRYDARQVGADVIYLANLIYCDYTQYLPRCFISITKTALFDSKIGVGGWDPILNKKSFKTKFHRMSRLKGFTSNTEVGKFSSQDIKELAELHCERWAFSGVTSAFANEKRLNEYICYPSNKVITKILIGDELFAVHYGMLYENTLLWHTPVINIKYLKYSPLTVLLIETVRYLKDNEIQCIDFGLGDESYKEYFTNCERTICDVLIPCSIRGIALTIIRNYMYPLQVKKVLISCRHNMKSIYYKIIAKLNKIYWYEMRDYLPISNLKNNFTCIDNYDKFVDFSRSHGFTIEKYHYDRLRTNSFFVVLHNLNSVLSYGWVSYGNNFYISEIDRTVSLQGKLILYDFNTELANRNKGYYSELLHCIVNKFNNETLAIFSSTRNKASNKAIENVGFKKLYTLTHHRYCLHD